jgi:hypothetical protein
MAGLGAQSLRLPAARKMLPGENGRRQLVDSAGQPEYPYLAPVLRPDTSRQDVSKSAGAFTPNRRSRQPRCAILLTLSVHPYGLILADVALWNPSRSERDQTQGAPETQVSSVHGMARLCPQPPVACHCDRLPIDATYQCCYADFQVSERNAGTKDRVDGRSLAGSGRS